MKVFYNLILIVLFSVACNRDDDLSCACTQALTPNKHARQTWQYMNMPRSAGSYNYPECTGEVYQIPPCALKKMSTQAVIQAIWEHPFFTDLLERGWYQTDFEALFMRNNAYMELTARKDAGAALLERLTLVDPLALLSQALEILTSQPSFLSRLNDDEKRTIVTVCEKNDKQRRFLDNSVYWNRITAWLLAGRTMLAAGYTPFADAVVSDKNLKKYLDGNEINYNDHHFYADDIMLMLIIRHSKIYISNDSCESASAPIPCEEIQRTWTGMNISRPADSYNYPVYPDTPEWYQLKSNEKDEAFQVPACVLGKMSTQAVIQAIWECGNTTDLLQTSVLKWQERIHGLLAKQNTYYELITRKDAGAALLERVDLIDRSYPSAFQISRVIELIISRSVFLSQLNSQQKRKLVEIGLRDNLIEDRFHRAEKCILVGRTMYAAGYLPFVDAVNDNEDLKWFIDGYDSNGKSYIYGGGWFIPSDSEQLIINYSKNFLN